MTTAMFPMSPTNVEKQSSTGAGSQFLARGSWGRLLLISAATMLLHASPAWAWGAEGHKVIAVIATTELTPSAKIQIQKMLGGDLTNTLEDASVWADRIRPYRRETAPWHYVDIEITSRGYDVQRDCPNNDCVVAQIEKNAHILGDRTSPPAVRVAALKFLIHFVGDVHQPLHCADDHDRGGNEVQVVAGRRHTNLHEIWDADVVEALGRQPEIVGSYLAARITAREKREWARGSASDWANESFGIAKREIYGRYRIDGTITEVTLPQGYARSEDQVAAVRLQKAGVRLAMLLNRFLGH